ncbi:hypothetical protein GGE65_006260 [Skermanella aerolata]|uniref:hypothetical protein n=1 Tax=Skermanella aerolata TaxID=393310 RepID=UPI003D20BA7E
MESAAGVWIVSVDDGALSGIDAVSGRIRERGAGVDRVLPLARIIRCRCSGATADMIRDILGVAEVEPKAVAESSARRQG